MLCFEVGVRYLACDEEPVTGRSAPPVAPGPDHTVEWRFPYPSILQDRVLMSEAKQGPGSGRPWLDGPQHSGRFSAMKLRRVFRRPAPAIAFFGSLAVALGVASASTPPVPPSPSAPASAVRHDVLAPVAGPVVPFPAGKRVPVGWPAFAVGSGPVILRLAAPGEAAAGPAALRLTTALDDRQPRVVEVALPGAGAEARVLGRFDLRFAHAIETFSLDLSGPDVAAVRTRGLALRLVGDGAPLWFFGGSTAPGPAAVASSAPLPAEFQPHVMTAPAGADRAVEFHRRFASLASVQTFGWMQGCVFDGLRRLGENDPAGPWLAAREAQWALFVPQPDRLVYEDPRSAPADGRIYGIEGALPFADLAFRAPASPLVDRFVAFARQHTRADGAIQDGATLSAEGSYTIAYPLAVIAAARRNAALADLARTQLRLRNERLWHDGAVWLRRTDKNTHTFRGWARGVAWHALGTARSIEPLRAMGDAAVAEAELRRLAAWVLPLQRVDGLWACFLEDPAAAVPDSSGSAGIAAALALGARLGVLEPAAAVAARRALAGVRRHLTPDGLLGGAAQSNRGGEELQRSDYRVLSQMGMGLLAQLEAECAP